MRRRIIAVIGASLPERDEAAQAERVGQLVAQAGQVLLTGGLGGVMEAASRGAHRAGGWVVGIVPTGSADDCNPFVDISIASGLGDGRNVLIAASADCCIAVGGRLGTLSEIAFALLRDKPVISLGSWDLNPGRLPQHLWLRADTPEQAVRLALETLAAR